MDSLLARYRLLLSKQVTRSGWVRCLIWGMVKTVIEGVAFFFEITNIWMRASLGLIWVGIAAPAVTLFIATQRSVKVLGFPGNLRVFFVLQIIALILLLIQLPLLALGIFFTDGFITILSTFLFVISGYAVSAKLRE
jgi:hypothetical protein